MADKESTVYVRRISYLRCYRSDEARRVLSSSEVTLLIGEIFSSATVRCYKHYIFKHREQAFEKSPLFSRFIDDLCRGNGNSFSNDTRTNIKQWRLRATKGK